MTQASGSPVLARGIDRRLFEYTRGTRRFLAATIVLGALTAALVVTQAALIAAIVARVVVDHETLAQVRTPLIGLALAIGARAGVALIGDRLADRASAAAKSDLRTALVEHLADLDPGEIEQARSARLAVLATNGIDALDSYFSRYLPQLFLAVIVPVTVIAVTAGADWASALIIGVTVPLIPYFMALVGASTKVRMQRQARLLQRLAGHFLDVVAGLSTLKVFGRAKQQLAAVRDITNRYRSATMATLKVAFLSSLILELLATFSVALVAVSVGLRLLGGHLSLQTALFVLILAPEAYLPLRKLGAEFHASAEGAKAAAEVFELLETPLPVRGTSTVVPDPSQAALQIRDLSVTYPGRAIAALSELNLTVYPGEILAIAGPSGCGKSTLLNVLLGFQSPASGSVRIGDTDLAELDPQLWRSKIAWVPQRPHLFARSILDNIRLGRPGATDSEVVSAIAAAGLGQVIDRLPAGLETRLGTDGSGLSAGERQRVALARAFLRDSPLLLLDEPTANLDGQTEEGVLQAVRRLMVGRTVLMVAHRPSLLTLADRVVDLTTVGAR